MNIAELKEGCKAVEAWALVEMEEAILDDKHPVGEILFGIMKSAATIRVGLDQSLQKKFN